MATKLVIGMDGDSIDLGELRRLVALANYLDIDDGALVRSNLSYVGFAEDTVEVGWPKVGVS